MHVWPPLQSAVVRQPLGATQEPPTHQLVGALHMASEVHVAVGRHAPEMQASPTGQSPFVTQVVGVVHACVALLHMPPDGQSASVRQPLEQVSRVVSQNEPLGQSASVWQDSASTHEPVRKSHAVPLEQSLSAPHGQPTPTQIAQPGAPVVQVRVPPPP